jgi:hypothetical protein
MTATNEVDFVVICEDLDWLEVTLGSVGAEIFVGSVGTDEVDFVVICEDLGLVEVIVGSVDTEIFVDSETASRRR